MCHAFFWAKNARTRSGVDRVRHKVSRVCSRLLLSVIRDTWEDFLREFFLVGGICRLRVAVMRYLGGMDGESCAAFSRAQAIFTSVMCQFLRVLLPFCVWGREGMCPNNCWCCSADRLVRRLDSTSRCPE